MHPKSEGEWPGKLSPDAPVVLLQAPLNPEILLRFATGPYSGAFGLCLFPKRDLTARTDSSESRTKHWITLHFGFAFNPQRRESGHLGGFLTQYSVLGGQPEKQIQLIFQSGSGISIVVTGLFQDGMELTAFAFLEDPDPSPVVSKGANEGMSRKTNCCAQGLFMHPVLGEFLSTIPPADRVYSAGQRNTDR